MTDAFVGVDVAFAKRKHLPVSICTWRDGRLVPEALRLLPFEPPRGQGNVATLDDTWVSEFVREAVDYVVQVCDHLRLAPRRIDDHRRLYRAWSQAFLLGAVVVLILIACRNATPLCPPRSSLSGLVGGHS